MAVHESGLLGHSEVHAPLNGRCYSLGHTAFRKPPVEEIAVDGSFHEYCTAPWHWSIIARHHNTNSAHNSFDSRFSSKVQRPSVESTTVNGLRLQLELGNQKGRGTEKALRRKEGSKWYMFGQKKIHVEFGTVSEFARKGRDSFEISNSTDGSVSAGSFLLINEPSPTMLPCHLMTDLILGRLLRR